MVKWKSPLSIEEQKLWQRVEIQSKSGGVIVGLFAKAAMPKATIVLGHPMGKEAKGYFIKNGYTELLINNNYNVLVFDINGFGESSQGSFSYYEDIVAIGKKAKELTPDLSIGYHGISLGGQWATIAFTDASHSYDFAIIESAATTIDEFWIHFPVAYKVLKVLSVLLPKYKKRINMLVRIKETKRLKSLLFIYSHSDTWTPVQMGERFLENCNIRSELWTIAEAKHAMVMKSNHKEEYRQKIVSYFNTAVKEQINHEMYSSQS